MQLMKGDCLERMKEIPDKSVDMVLTDPPYGTTRNTWDIPIDAEKMWEQIRRITKLNAAVLLFGQMPYGAELIMSNRKEYRYEWIWKKTASTGFLNCNRMPLKIHDSIQVFYRKLPTYNPQIKPGKRHQRGGNNRGSTNWDHFTTLPIVYSDKMYPTDVIEFSNGKRTGLHPTAKPVPLLEYLIKTYTNENEVVLDFCMGSGSTGIACINTNRDFIGIELDDDYYAIAEQRIKATRPPQATA